MAAGYVVAVLAAWGAVSVHVLFTSDPVSQASSGMLAFGDSLLFVAVFGLFAGPTTGAALYFLRPVDNFWRIGSWIAVAFATTGIAALVVMRSPAFGGAAGGFASMAPFRILAAPVLGGVFLLALLFAPTRGPRLVFAGATLVELVVIFGAFFFR